MKCRFAYLPPKVQSAIFWMKLPAMPAMAPIQAPAASLDEAMGRIWKIHKNGANGTLGHNKVRAEKFLAFLGLGAGELSAMKGKRVLNLGCGSECSGDDNCFDQFVEKEPWMARIFHELGASVFEVDIARQPEKGGVANMARDLSRKHALSSLASGTFDYIICLRLIDFGEQESPIENSKPLRETTLPKQRKMIVGNLMREIERLLCEKGRVAALIDGNIVLLEKSGGRLSKIKEEEFTSYCFCLKATVKEETPMPTEEVPPALLQKETFCQTPASSFWKEPLFDDFNLSIILASALSLRTPSFELNSRLCDEMASFTAIDVRGRLGRDYEMGEKSISLGPSFSRASDILGAIGINRGSLHQAKGMKYLDLAGGSSNSMFMNEAEPWDARFMHECGAEVHLVDIGAQIAEKFPTYQLDLTKKGALDTFKSGYFDCIACLSFMDFAAPEGRHGTAQLDLSLHLKKTTDGETRERTKDEILSQATRLLKEGGVFVTIYDGYLTAFQKQGERLFSAEKDTYL